MLLSGARKEGGRRHGPCTQVAGLCALAVGRRREYEVSGEPLGEHYQWTLAHTDCGNVAREFSRTSGDAVQDRGSSGAHVVIDDHAHRVCYLDGRISLHLEWGAASNATGRSD